MHHRVKVVKCDYDLRSEYENLLWPTQIKLLSENSEYTTWP